jgi:hypothetical protein
MIDLEMPARPDPAMHRAEKLAATGSSDPLADIFRSLGQYP